MVYQYDIPDKPEPKPLTGYEFRDFSTDIAFILSENNNGDDAQVMRIGKMIQDKLDALEIRFKSAVEGIEKDNNNDLFLFLQEIIARIDRAEKIDTDIAKAIADTLRDVRDNLIDLQGYQKNNYKKWFQLKEEK